MSSARRTPSRDDGLTLVELLVTMVIAAITLPLIFVVLVGAQSQTVSTTASARSVADARLVLQVMQRQVNDGAQPLLVSGDGRSLGYWTEQPVAGLPAGARCVQYSVVTTGVGSAARTDLRLRSWRLSEQRPLWADARVLATDVSTGSRFAQVSVVVQEVAAASLALTVRHGSDHPASVSTVLTARNRAATALASPHPCQAFS